MINCPRCRNPKPADSFTLDKGKRKWCDECVTGKSEGNKIKDSCDWRTCKINVVRKKDADTYGQSDDDKKACKTRDGIADKLAELQLKKEFEL